MSDTSSLVARTASPVPGFFADPCLTVVGDTFYLVPTTDGHADWGSTEFRLFSSTDLHTWTDHGVILDLARDVSWESEKAWAPMLVARAGLFYLYFSANDNIGVATATSPTGPFRDSGRPLIAAGQFSGRAIDPSVFVDDDGSAYLLWGNNEAHLARLSDDMLSIEPGSVRTWHLEHFREAPWMHKEQGRYHLSWSENDTRDDDYRVRCASADSIDGPWENSTVLLQMDPSQDIYATGHHSIARHPNQTSWIIAYHRFAIPGGDGFHREIAFAPLHHNADGTIKPVQPTRHGLQL